MFPSAVVGLPWVSTAKALAFSTWHLALSGNTKSLVASFRRATTSAGVRGCLPPPEVSPRVIGRRSCMLTSGPETSTIKVPVLYSAAAVPSECAGSEQASRVRAMEAFEYILFPITRILRRRECSAPGPDGQDDPLYSSNHPEILELPRVRIIHILRIQNPAFLQRRPVRVHADYAAKIRPADIEHGLVRQFVRLDDARLRILDRPDHGRDI